MAVEPPRTERTHPAMGERLRAERRRHGMSLRELADRVSLSPSLLSQVETGRAQPSVATLYAVAGVLGISLDELLFPNGRGPGSDAAIARSAAETIASERFVQRAASRKRIRLASGVVWERLTPESEPDTEFLHVVYEVGGASCPEHEFQRHRGHEWGFVLDGRLRVTIGFDDYELGPGDAVTLDSSTPHRLANAGTEPVHAVWFVLGRHGSDRPGAAAPPHPQDPHG